MRLWSIHPNYLDSKGLVALWRESLLAQNVLLGKTKGYKNHPQLLRFKQSNDPLGAIAEYLRHIDKEAKKRKYQFDSTKIIDKRIRTKIPVTRGQVKYETGHLLKKLSIRSPDTYEALRELSHFELHPLFVEISGSVEAWEAVK